MSVLTVDSLLTALPEGVVVTDPATLENYRYDWSRDPGAGTPLAVVRPTDAAQVQTVVRWCGENRVPIVPRGAGTSLSGGSSAVDGGIVLSLERMRAIEIDTTTRVAVVEPGAFNVEVKAAAAERGLWYPPGPVVVRDLLDRRQHRHQRGRSVLREVRRHHRLRARTGRGAGRRRADHPRRQADQGRRRSLAAQAVRRIRGDARHHHPGRPAAAAGAAAPGDPGGDLPRSRGGRAGGRRAGDSSPDRRWSS